MADEALLAELGLGLGDAEGDGRVGAEGDGATEHAGGGDIGRLRLAMLAEQAAPEILPFKVRWGGKRRERTREREREMDNAWIRVMEKALHVRSMYRDQMKKLRIRDTDIVR